MIRFVTLERVFRWSSLKVLKCPARGSVDGPISVHEKPFHGLNAPDRFSRGDVVIAWHDEGTVMGYTWPSLKDLWARECRLFLSVGSDEAVTYDAFVFPPYRGRGLYTKIESAALTAPMRAVA